MRCQEIIETIEKTYPLNYALEWDNSGFLAGRYQKDVKRIYVALDATDDVIEAAVRDRADLLITHHPMLFSPIRRVTDQEFTGRRLLCMIQEDLAYYAMHTNYDVLRMSELSADYLELTDQEILDVTCETPCRQGIGRVAELRSPIKLKTYCEMVKEAFDLPAVQAFGDLDRPVKRIAVSPGSGKSMIGPALEKGADVLVTGDIGHHEGIDAVSQGLSIIDAGHYGIEHIFVEDMRRFLAQTFENVTVTGDVPRQPFSVL